MNKDVDGLSSDEFQTLLRKLERVGHDALTPEEQAQLTITGEDLVRLTGGNIRVTFVDDNEEADSGTERPRRYFTHYWTSRTCASLKAGGSEGDLLDHTAGNNLRRKGISPGDAVYVVSLLRGQFVLVGKLEVDRVCDTHEAARIMGVHPEHMWDAEDQLLAASATAMTFDRMVPLDLTEQLRFLTSNGPQPPFFESPGHLDKQTIRGLREITPESAVMLDSLLPPLVPVSFTGSQKIDFESRVQEEAYRRMVQWLLEIFGDLVSLHPTVPAAMIILSEGSPVVYVSALPIAEDMAVINARTFVVVGARITPGLMEFLLRENAGLPLGSLGLDQEDRIVLDHSFHGLSENPDDLRLAVSVVAGLADSLSHQIISRWGGISGKDYWDQLNA